VSTQVLVVCHANICRSPMAAVMLSQRLSSLGVDAAVSSAGLLHSGEPAASLGIEVMAARDLDLAAHRSTRLERTLVDDADLVLAMERAQLREAVLLSPAVWPRCFTVKELARRAELVGPRDDSEPLRDWLMRVHQGRETSMLLGRDPSDDLADPYGGSKADFEQTAAELDTLLDRITLLAWGRGVS
jgi:protein-tyrosine phosphatase